MKKYLVVNISTYGEAEEDPKVLANNLAWPEIVQYVADEQEVFVIDPVSREFVEASSFFHMNNYTEFFVDE